MPFAAGGAVDVAGRLIGQSLQDQLHATVVIENRGGSGGITGMEAVANAPPDAILILASHSGLTALPGLYPNLRFEPASLFEAVVTAMSGSYTLVVPRNSQFKSLSTDRR